MLIVIMILLGLCFGSFVNALVWRLHEHRDFVHERSECIHCHHELAAKDLVPVLSWLWLKGKCRYCHKPISVQYPLVEAATAALFVTSYVFWPSSLQGGTLQWIVFGLWLVLLIGLMALLVYDLKWMLLPDKIIFPLMGVALAMQVAWIADQPWDWHLLLVVALAVLVGGGLFWLLFQISNGKWIGGGDVKLGFLLGLMVGTAEKSLFIIFLAGVLGSLVSLPLLASKRLKRSSAIPFGPFLIIAGIITLLFGQNLTDWYNHTFLLLG